MNQTHPINQKINFIIIEDVEMQREDLKLWIQNNRPDLNYIADFSNHLDAYHFLLSKDAPSVDLMFLDVELPGKGDGLTLLKQLYGKLKPHPKVIIISAYDYMREALQQIYTVSWYIEKAIDEAKLNQAIQKIVDEFEKEKPSPKPTIPTFIEFGGMLIPVKDIMFFESRNSDKILNRQGGEKIKDRISMFDLEKKLSPFTHFTRVHESYIINRNPKYLHSLDKKRTVYTMKCPKTGEIHLIPISFTYRTHFEGI